jgi:putative membrane protein
MTLDHAAPDEGKALLGGSASTELASNRTAMAFERTRMASDRTLMAMLRTALSLISFGFTIFQFFRKIAGQLGVEAVTAQSARRFGISLVALGVGLLVAGLFTHYAEMRNLDRRRRRLHELSLLRHGPRYNSSPTVVISLLLLAVGLLAVVGMMLRTGPFH